MTFAAPAFAETATRPWPAGRSGQACLFGAEPLPAGLYFEADFLGRDDEGDLLAAIAAMPLHEARYKAYTARRRIASFGTQYDFEANELQRCQPLPASLKPLSDLARALLARAGGSGPRRFTNALVAEYAPGTPLGWHRDVPDFEIIVGFSLLGSARMRLRPYPPTEPRRHAVQTIELPPRSAYVLQGEARWGWQHSIAPTDELRYSITFRTPADPMRHRRSR